MHFFFFKQKTAYEMLRSLVGSEMCIRDSMLRYSTVTAFVLLTALLLGACGGAPAVDATLPTLCLLYTSDAADDLLCVDLGGRRIIKKKTSKVKDRPP